MILTDNLFGDILSDEAAAIAGSIGRAALGFARRRARPSTSRSTAPRPTSPGKGIANPTGAILTVAMMLEHVFRRPQMARAVEKAMVAALREVRTPDIGGHATTAEFTDAVLRNLSGRAGRPTPRRKQ